MTPPLPPDVDEDPALALCRLGQVSNAVNLHLHAEGYHACPYRSPCGLDVAKDFRVSLVHRVEFFDIVQEYGALDDIFQIGAAATKYRLHVLQNQPRLVPHVSLRINLTAYRIHRTLTGNKQEITRTHRG